MRDFDLGPQGTTCEMEIARDRHYPWCLHGENSIHLTMLWKLPETHKERTVPSISRWFLTPSELAFSKKPFREIWS